LEPEHEENDQRDSESLYKHTRNSNNPTYYENRTKWLSMMRESIKSIVPRFSTHRMVKEYMDKTYVKAFINSERLSRMILRMLSATLIGKVEWSKRGTVFQ